MNLEFVMLGKTVPEPTNERLDHYVCSAGWSPGHGLVRLYPLGLQGTPRRWSVNRVDVMRHAGNKDSRAETWLPISAFGSTGTLPPRLRRDVLESCLTSGVVEANDRKLSLSVMRPVDPEFRLEDVVTDDEPSYRLYADGEALKARERFAHVPRVKFKTEDGRKHNLQMRDWGVWELMRKQHERLGTMSADEREAYVGGALHICEETLFLVGNYANHRTSWLVISALNVP